MKTNIILYATIAFFGVLAVYAFKEGNRQKRGLKFRNKPGFNRLKLDEKKINDHSKI